MPVARLLETAADGRRRITLAQWVAEGTRRYGKDMRAWAFRCPACGMAQTAHDGITAGLSPSQVGHVCIGGCDVSAAPVTVDLPNGQHLRALAWAR